MNGGQVGGVEGYGNVRPMLKIRLLSQVALVGMCSPDWSACHLEMVQFCVDDVEQCPDHLQCVTTKVRGKRQGIRQKTGDPCKTGKCLVYEGHSWLDFLGLCACVCYMY